MNYTDVYRNRPYGSSYGNEGYSSNEEKIWTLIDGPIADGLGGTPARFFLHRTEPLMMIEVGAQRIFLTKAVACDWQRAVGRIFAHEKKNDAGPGRPAS